MLVERIESFPETEKEATRSPLNDVRFEKQARVTVSAGTAPKQYSYR